MHKAIWVPALLLGLVTARPHPASAISHLWSHSFGSTGTQTGNAVATDAAGNIYVTGSFFNSIDFGGGPLFAVGGGNIFVAKFNSAGTYQWARRFGHVSPTNGVLADGEAIALDTAGNIYLYGVFDGDIDIDGFILGTTGPRDIFLTKLDPTGEAIWYQHFLSPDYKTCGEMAVDGSGNVFVTGDFSSFIQIWGTTYPSQGNNDIFVARFDTNGLNPWVHTFGDASDQRGIGLATDPSGNVFVAGWINGSVDFGGGLRTSAGLSDVFLAKFNGSGTHLWSARYGDAGSQYATALATDASGNVYMTGANANGVDFGGGLLTSAGSYDVFLAKFNPGGVHQWSAEWGDASTQSGGRIAVGPLGDVFLGGSFTGAINFGGGLLTSAGLDDAYLVQFNASGVHQWSARFGDANKYQGISSVAARPTNGCVVTGLFLNTIDFGGGPLTSSDYIDMFLASFGTLPTGVGDAPARGALAISS
ncbi:MAG TPA: SBBP repeat-containing protein, partial [Candidatus Krumholzibacteria bacterium]|nr:SBBP repeat-containing protein [Candidatus Krumholzibacteria bacterium]